MRLIDSVADVTGHRDRAVVESTMVEALRSALDACAVRLVPLDVTRAERRAARAAPAAARLRARCVRTGTVARGPGEAGRLTVFPIPGPGGVLGGTVEIESRGALAHETERLVLGLLRIYRNHLELLDYGERDALTGLLNRKTFEPAFARAAAASNAEPRWLAVADLDHFKTINDRFGHLIGDEVLILVANALRAAFGPPDAPFRFGGEEFVLVLGGEDGEARLARFVEHVAAASFPQVGRMTLSVGYTRLGPQDSSASALERADRAVYAAKQSGRNRAASFEALLAAGLVGAVEARGGDVELF
jgi:diguanylate cyclase (GGDEF)-like protein